MTLVRSAHKHSRVAVCVAVRCMFHCVRVPRGVMADENGTFCTHTLSLTQTGCDDASISSPRASPYVLDTHSLCHTHTDDDDDSIYSPQF